MKKKAPRKPHKNSFFSIDDGGILWSEMRPWNVYLYKKNAVALRNWLNKYIAWAEYKRGKK